MQMLPCFASDDVVNSVFRNSIFASEFHLCGFSGIESPQNFSHLTLGDRGTVMTLTTARSILGNSIRDVISIGSEEEMSRVHTQSIVAVMADSQVVGNRPVRQEPGVAMRGPASVVGWTRNAPVTSARRISGPNPAAIGTGRFIDARPESALIGRHSVFAHTGGRAKRLRRPIALAPRNGRSAILACVLRIGRLRLHRNNPFGATPPAVSAARGHLNL